MQEEVSKHVRKIHSVAKSKRLSIRNKITDILIEIFIIVFAVSLSIYLHGWNEHRKEKKEVKVFLANLKEDLEKDIKLFEDDKKEYKMIDSIYNKMLALTQKELDAYDKQNGKLQFAMQAFSDKYSSASYEGFKSSSKMGLIENESLKKQILLYYQNYAQTILELDRFYNQSSSNTFDQFMRMASKSNKATYLDPEFRMRINFLLFLSQNNKSLYDKYAINPAKKIVKMIDQELAN